MLIVLQLRLMMSSPQRNLEELLEALFTAVDGSKHIGVVYAEDVTRAEIHETGQGRAEAGEFASGVAAVQPPTAGNEAGAVNAAAFGADGAIQGGTFGGGVDVSSGVAGGDLAVKIGRGVKAAPLVGQAVVPRIGLPPAGDGAGGLFPRRLVLLSPEFGPFQGCIRIERRQSASPPTS